MFYFILLTIATGSQYEAQTTKATKVSYASLWLPRSFRITCCLGGFPVPENPQLTRNWTYEESDYVIDERYTDQVGRTTDKEATVESNCRIFHGSFLLSASALFTFDDFSGIGVLCKCPELSNSESLDRNCRRLKPCLNNGYRSFSSSSQCICPEPYFGEQCEKYCDQGQRMKGADGRDYCGCVPFYQGEECRDMVCLNGGTEIRRRCRCPPNFLGYHCEIDANRTSAVSRFHGYGEQTFYQDNDLFTRDVSGTIFSLIMIVVLVLSMYLLMKHRMQNRFAMARREAASRSGFGISSRRGNIILPEDPRMMSFRAIPLPDDGPPPYIHTNRGRIAGLDRLPPLPSYEDATKLPPLTRSSIVTSEETNSPTELRVEVSMTDEQFTDVAEASEAQPSTSLPEEAVELENSISDGPRLSKNSSTRRSI